MYKTLRILFCLLAAVSVAVAVFIFVYFNWWGFVPVAAALIFGGLMVLFKNLQENLERKQNPPPPVGDFITGKVPLHKDENEE